MEKLGADELLICEKQIAESTTQIRADWSSIGNTGDNNFDSDLLFTRPNRVDGCGKRQFFLISGKVRIKLFGSNTADPY
ncbi:MAG: hypothetical protein KKB51_02330 [Candidatus Riflebacteria bacterium]|nr:hypothetical protein [Candidatus Riflebacteria bacterium]